jgi:hypothetical protein
MDMYGNFMNNKPFLKALSSLVSNHLTWSAFQEKLDYDIEQHQRKLEQATELSEMFKAQGAIAALRQLKYLKDEINHAN